MNKRKFFYIFIICLLLTIFLLIMINSASEINMTSSIQHNRITPTVIIDAGHGGEDGGAVSDSGILEKDINLEIAKETADLLTVLGFDTIKTRNEDISLSTDEATIRLRKVADMKKRLEIFNSSANNVILSIHQNKFTDNKYFGTQIFYKASNLKTIYYNSNFGGGSDNPFLNNNSIEKVVFGGQVVPLAICKNCSTLKEVVILNSITIIESSAFNNCDSLTKLTIPSSVTQIKMHAIENCEKLERVEIACTDIELASWVFTDCPNLKEIHFEGTIEDWLNLYFYYEGSPCQNGANLYVQGKLLTTVAWDDVTTSITQLLFDGCISIETVIIPDSIVSILSAAFNGCRNLSTVYYGGTVADWENITVEQENTFLTSASRYYYSESQPTDTTYQYWHYVDGVPTPW